MPNKRRYMYLHKGDNEWLAQPPPIDDTTEEWQQAWEELKTKCPHQIEFTEDFYCNSDYGETPEWIDVTIHDEGVLFFKMARGALAGIKGANSVVFTSYFEAYPSNEWGASSFEKLIVQQDCAFVVIQAKHSSEEVEVNITEQFNQAIGESV